MILCSAPTFLNFSPGSASGLIVELSDSQDEDAVEFCAQLEGLEGWVRTGQAAEKEPEADAEADDLRCVDVEQQRRLMSAATRFLCSTWSSARDRVMRGCFDSLSLPVEVKTTKMRRPGTRFLSLSGGMLFMLTVPRRVHPSSLQRSRQRARAKAKARAKAARARKSQRPGSSKRAKICISHLSFFFAMACPRHPS